jgi:hypothetical protein
MAFVYKAERSYKNQKIGETDSIGPGEYLPQTDLKRIKISKSPFMSNSLRSDYIYNDNPGPGSYYHDETLINYLKNIQNEKISSQNDRVHLMSKGNTIELQPNAEKLGFLNKEKRFKIKNNNENVPGPGFYYNEENRKKLKYFKINNNNNNSVPKKSYEKNYNNLIPTIPSIKQQFGFDILEDGKLVQKQNPDFYKTFTGEKGDTVGPGSYDIETPNNWLKTGTEWSKFRTTRDFNFKKKPEQKSSVNFSLQSTKYSENTNKSKESLLNSKNLYQNQSIENNNKKANNKNILNCRIINVKNENKKLPNKKETFETVIQKNFPGPGYYYDSIKSSQFKRKFVPEFKQFFGSKLERFLKNKENNSLGPGQYFTNEIDKDNLNSTYYFSKTQKNFAPFSIKSERFSKSVENKDFPGPGNYETQSSFKKKFLQTFSKFGTTEKRFADNGKTKWQYKTPGPGSYIDINTNSTIGKIKEYTINNFYKNPIFSIYNNTFYKPNKIQNIKPNKDVIPPIGLYNPDMIYTIDYNIKKKNKDNNGKIAFDSGVSKEKKEEKSSLGPGYYYREKKIIKKQIMPPFNQGDIKSKFLDSNQILNGPGQYNLDSYYDWNKKSYNVNFV